MTRCFRKNIVINSETLAFWSSMLVSVEVLVEALYIQVQMLGVEPTKNLGLLSDGQLRRLHCRKGNFGRCLFFHCFSSSLFCWGGFISDSVCFRGVGGSTAFLGLLHFYHSPTVVGLGGSWRFSDGWKPEAIVFWNKGSHSDSQFKHGICSWNLPPKNINVDNVVNPGVSNDSRRFSTSGIVGARVLKESGYMVFAFIYYTQTGW